MEFFHIENVLDAPYGLPVTHGDTNWWRRMGQLLLPALCAGDVLRISGRGCIVNTTSYNIQIIDELTVGAGCNWVDEGPSWGYVIMPPAGMNITPNNHYWTRPISWAWQAPAAVIPSTLEWRVKAHADLADGTVLPMLQGYFGFQCEIVRA